MYYRFLMKTLHIIFLSFFISCVSVFAQNDAFEAYNVVYSQNFSKEKCLHDFDFSDASKWLISKNGVTGKALKCLGQGSYESKYNSPSVMAVLKAFELKDFVLEMDVMQNGKDYSLLDFCIFFGIKDADHYCYAQLANKADKKNHNLFTVDGAKPQRMSSSANKGVFWGMTKWQHIRMERTLSDKKVKVYFNGQLIFEISDESFLSWHVGFGSTNSAVKIDNFKLSAPTSRSNEKSFF